ncbi:MAG: hypothetical protein IPO40_20735 [Fibrobacteres bacterium]|nr:hypothetical protein [Fibrobacterota bacterium]
MSWDLILMKVPQEIESYEELDEDYIYPEIGTDEAIRKVIAALFPDADVATPGSVDLDIGGHVFEISYDSEDEITNIYLNLHDGSKESLEAIYKLSAALNCRAFDMTEGEFLQIGDEVASGFVKWNESLEQVQRILSQGNSQA